MSYDALDRLITAENAAGLRTEFSYDRNDNVTQVVNKNKATGSVLNSESAQYNELDLLKSSTDPMGRVTTVEYDKNGNLESAAYPNGKGVVYTYDAVDRLTGISYTGDTTTWSFQYDQNGNMTSAVKNGAETTAYSYDSRDRLTRVDFPVVGGVSHNANYQYDPAGQIVNIQNSPLAADPVKFTYDQSGYNVDVFGPNQSQASFMRDEEGRVKKAYLADNNTGMFYNTYLTYDATGQVVKLRTEGKQGQVLKDYSYLYDKNGNRTREKDELSGSYTDYLYDAVNQLTAEKYYSASGTLTKEITCQYDLLGNRTQKSVTENGGAPVTSTYGYNAANEITNVNGTVYTHDGNGNLTSDGQRTYVYDAEDQLTS